MVVVAIIGILAAVAIPAYNAYQENAKVGVVKSSLQQVIKAVNACLAIGEVTACGTNDVNGTVRAQANTTIMGLAGTSTTAAVGTTNEYCFVVAYQTGGSDTQKACVALDENGNIAGTFPTDAQIKAKGSGACMATTGACTN